MKVAIVGGASNAAHLLRPDWQIWRLGRYALAYPKVSRLFELHKPEVYREWIPSMNATGVPVLVQHQHPGLENAELLDLGELVDRWGYVTNSIAAMIAVAIRDGASNIELHGCPMADGGIYAHQKPSVMYWFGIATGSGIEIEDCSGMVNWRATYG